MNGIYVDRNCAFIKMGGRLNIINEKFSKLLRYRHLAPDKLLGELAIIDIFISL
tara:strand:+ start:77 stop:238 length:162 start_codon:yes stop_codon:yes gene_type:complete